VAGDLVGIVLGAGSSTRLGRPKQTLPLGGTTVLGWCVRAAEASALDRVIVVLGGAADGAAASLDPGRSALVRNAGYASGCASSLQAGLDAASDAGGIVMLLGDMPGVDATIIDSVIDEWRSLPSWGAVTRYDDGLGHPFVFSADAFATLRGLHGDKAVWKIVDHQPEKRVRRIRVHRALPRDIDTREDYEAVCRQLGVNPH
jgi:molybdenum cofactor cytidylyltransferase